MLDDEPQAEARSVTREQALQMARGYIFEQYGEPRYSWDTTEPQQLATELASRAVAEALRAGDTALDLAAKLSWCISFVENLKHAGRPTRVYNAFHASEVERTDQDRAIVERYRDIVWRRHRPSESFQSGRDSDQHYDVDKMTVPHLSADYLSRTWARHSMVDWALLDMMITRETCAYGEALKMSGQVGKTRLLGDYFASGGDLSKMKGSLQFNLASWALHFFLGWIGPIAAIWFSFQAGYETIGWIFVGLFVLATAWWLFTFVLRFGIKIYWYATGKTDPADKPIQIMQAMFDTWTSLEGPVVNPTIVKEHMVKSRDLGAVWDGASWAIIDRAIAIDPAVMVTKTKAAV